MAAQTKAPPQAKSSDKSSGGKSSGVGKFFTLITGIVCFGLLGYLFLAIVHQIVVPPPAHRLILIQDIPLPSGLPTLPSGQPSLTEERSLIPGAAQSGATLNPGVEVKFDHFDFQAYDPDLHLLFIAHTGPNPDLLAMADVGFDPKRDGPYDGHIIVFDTNSNTVVGRINIPQVAGLLYVHDPAHGLDKIFAGDATNDIVYDIDPRHYQTVKPIAIPLHANESPDAMSYDPVDQRLFVSDPGSPADPNKNMNADRNNENVAVIDAVHDTVLQYINLGNITLLPGEKVPANMLAPGNIPLFGHDVGHNQYFNGFIYVASQILADANAAFLDPSLLPPAGTGELFQINAVNLKVVNEIDLPPTCSTPHGFAIDASQHMGFIACTDIAAANSGRTLFENLVRVDLGDPTTMKVIQDDPQKMRLQGGADIIRIDQNSSLHIDVLFVACLAGISIFDITPGHFQKLGDEIIGKGTHTIAIDEATQTLYLPIIIGGRPVLRIVRFNPNGQSSF